MSSIRCACSFGRSDSLSATEARGLLEQNFCMRAKDTKLECKRADIITLEDGYVRISAEDNHRKPSQIVYLVSDGDKAFLADLFLDPVSGRYDRIELVYPEDNEPIYKVWLGGLCGIIDFRGEVIVPIEYDEISRFILDFNDGFYIGKRDTEYNSKDIYDINGALIFGGVEYFCVAEECYRYFEPCMYEGDEPPSKTVTSVYVGSVKEEQQESFDDDMDSFYIDCTDEYRISSLTEVVAEPSSPDAPRQLAVANIKRTCRYKRERSNYDADGFYGSIPISDGLYVLHESMNEYYKCKFAEEKGIVPDDESAEIFVEYCNEFSGMSRERILAADICKLNMSVREYNVLKHGGVNSIGDLLALTDEMIVNFRNVGERTKGAIIEYRDVVIPKLLLLFE